MEDSSQITRQFFETSKNCMTLLWRWHVVAFIITNFCTRKSWIKETATTDKDNILAMLSLYLSLVVFQLGGLHYRLCYSNKFIITFNEGLGLQLLGIKLLDFSQVLLINSLKFELRGRWPGTLGRQSGDPGPPGCQLGVPGPLVVD